MSEQAKVDELGNKLRVALGDLDVANKNLKDRYAAFQLIRQEADELQKRVSESLKLIKSIRSENNLWGSYQIERQIELLEQALKINKEGGNNGQ